MNRLLGHILQAVFAVGSVWLAPVALADDVFDQARELLRDEQFDDAIAVLDRAVQSSPEEAKYVGLRGVARLHQGDYARGAADLKAAIELHPDDLGNVYRPSTDAKLTDEALEHGRRQVEQMMRDRPAMAQFGEKADFLREWAVRKFAGEDFGEPIDWDPEPPLHSDAEHLAPDGDDHAMILVAADYDGGPHDGEPRSFEELWSGVVYELHNVNNAREFVRLHNEAEEGKIAKQDFVADILKLELHAAQQARAFYVQLMLPWLEAEKLATEPKLWFCEWWDTPDDVLHSFTDKAAYPWRPYARTHDWATVHRYWRQKNCAKAMRLLEQMWEEEGYEEEREDVEEWMERCGEEIVTAEDAEDAEE